MVELSYWLGVDRLLVIIFLTVSRYQWAIDGRSPPTSAPSPTETGDIGIKDYFLENRVI